jgi:DNA repair protein RecO (recombination protein O)
LPRFVAEGGTGSWDDILEGLALSGHFLMRDVLTDRSSLVSEARVRLVERMKRAAGTS